jgi:ThiF family/Prokaryotic homologs of the JAB domain
MRPATTFALAGTTHEALKRHLFPGDGLEAAALLLCTQTPGPRIRWLVRDVIPIPYDECQRARDRLSWPGAYLESAIDRAETEDLSIVPIHSHPSANLAFSPMDDASDQIVIRSLLHGCEREHGSAVMTQDGGIRCRLYDRDLRASPVELVAVAGHELLYFWNDEAAGRPLAFTSAMRDELSRLSACVIGVSGTGSIVAEQLGRLGLGHICLVEFDRVELRNLNRILNSTHAHVEAKRFKVDVLAEAIASYRGSGIAEPIAQSILSRPAVLAASQCDILFCCVDSLEARYIADLLCAAFLLPLIDVGVTIPVRNAKGSISIADVCGRVDYVQPGRSALADRGVYAPETLRAEYLRKADPATFAQERDAGYLKGLPNEAPSVITVNMRAGAAAVNEFIARAYPFRIEANDRFARTVFSLKASEEDYTSESEFPSTDIGMFARGQQEPLLGLPALRATGL